MWTNSSESRVSKRKENESVLNIEQINELEPLRFPEPSKEEDGAEEGTDENEETAEIEDPDHGKSETDIIDEITGQMKLF